MSYIEINNLSYWYPEENVESIKELNISVEDGEVFFIMGRSGSGKSTVGKIISGAIPSFYGGKIKGTVSIDGKHLNNMSHADRAREITMVFQDPERQLMMNKVHREIAFGLENIGIDGKEIKRRVWEAMQFVNITNLADRDISTLSGGEKQKVAIASAISYLPKCIIFDEPTSQLDPASAEEVVELVKKINEELGITIILIEQRIDKWFDIADKILLINDGKAVFHGHKKEFFLGRNEDIKYFLPIYLRLADYMNMQEMPKGIKHMRNELKKYSFVFNKFIEQSYSRDKNCILIKGLRVNYQNISALKEVDLRVREGEFLTILGPNGAGKSTLLKTITGLNKYDGSIKIEEKEVRKLGLKDISKITAYVSQNPNDYISKDTVYEEIKFTLVNHGISDFSKIDKVMEKLGITSLKDKNPRDISGGERQRLAIACMLVTEPKMLLLDEPTRGLDAKLKSALGDTLREINSKGTTILMITHDIEFSSEYCNRFILMFNGEIVADGSKEQVLTNGIYYTTTMNKLVRHLNKSVFNINQVAEMKIQ